MRVLHLIETTGPGGAETVFVEIAVGLVRRGHTSLPVVHGPGWVADALRSAGVEPLMIPSGKSPDLAFLARVDALVRGGVDVIQTHLIGSAASGSVVGRFRGVPVVATLHGVNDIGPSSRGRSARLTAIRWGATRAVFVSESLRRSLNPIMRVPPSRAAVVHNGIDCDRFTPRRDGEFRRELGVTGEQILVGGVGNVRPAKDYATLLRAAAVLAGRSARWRFVVVGDKAEQEFPLFAQLQSLQQELGLADRVAFVGFRPDVERAINGMDVLLCSSSAEGFSLTTCQAMACGVPVVSTRCGGPEEILTDGTTGLLVDVGEPGQIADAVERVATDTGLRERLVGAARADVVSRFSLESMLAAYQQIYSDVVSTRAAR